MVARHPTTHVPHSYRCFLPDLAGFRAARCAGPDDRPGTLIVLARQRKANPEKVARP